MNFLYYFSFYYWNSLFDDEFFTTSIGLSAFSFAADGIGVYLDVRPHCGLKPNSFPFWRKLASWKITIKFFLIDKFSALFDGKYSNILSFCPVDIFLFCFYLFWFQAAELFRTKNHATSPRKAGFQILIVKNNFLHVFEQKLR